MVEQGFKKFHVSALPAVEAVSPGGRVRPQEVKVIFEGGSQEAVQFDTSTRTHKQFFPLDEPLSSRNLPLFLFFTTIFFLFFYHALNTCRKGSRQRSHVEASREQQGIYGLVVIVENDTGKSFGSFENKRKKKKHFTAARKNKKLEKKIWDWNVSASKREKWRVNLRLASDSPPGKKACVTKMNSLVIESRTTRQQGLRKT